MQLTELGFPEIFHPQEASVAETASNSNDSNDLCLNHTSSTSVSDQPKPSLKSQQPAEVNKASSQTVDLAQGTQTEAQNTPPAQSKAIKKAAQTKPEQAKGDDTEDSDVSYEEEEIEEDDDFCEEDEEEDEEEEDAESANGGNFQCTVCSLQCPSMFKLQDHMNIHTGARPYSCAECGKRFSQIHNYRGHLRTHAQAKLKQPKCRICLKRFVTEDDLKLHLTLNHFEDKFYECDRCKRIFTSLVACEHHIEFTCMRKVMCEKCGRYFPKEKHLKRHMNSLKCCNKLKCTECPKVFTKKNALLKHSFSHLGLLPYTCVRCRCHFRLARLYLRHKCKPQSIHCVACLREFLSDEDFQQHKKDTGCWGNQEPKGDEIRCLECGQRFDTKEDLKKHAGAHQRVLKCAECGKGFRSALLLMSHMGGHAGQSPCLCQNCGLGFPHQQSYDGHLKTCGKTPQVTKPSKKHSSSKKTEKEAPKPAMQTSTASTPNSGKSVSTTSPAQCSSGQNSATERPSLQSISAPSNCGASSTSASPSLETTGPSKSSSSPNQEKHTSPPDTDSAEGCWKLSLDKPPPPGVNLVLFLPVCQTDTDSLIMPCSVPQVMPVPRTLSNGLTAVGELSTNAGGSVKQEPNPIPLDLSKNSTSSMSTVKNEPRPSIKSEPEEFEVSGQTTSGDEDKKTLDKNNASSGQKRQANGKPKSEHAEPDFQPLDYRAQKKIKMETDDSSPTK